ncbi:MAG: hypothetical protein LC768_04175 [Acidobacteria bacterium]|nr:hypothetical protein [Acidobacteriota bacterium]MCA1637522.1 hypothetical protein [Acidobacteriota bacterium]
MYCSKCGSLVNDELNYCNSCGEKLAKAKDKDAPKSMLDDILTSLCFIAIFGFVFFVGLVAILLDKSVPETVLLMVSLAYLAVLFGICFMLLRQVPKLINANLKENNAEKSEVIKPTQLSSPIAAQLEEPREPVLSVTENTTRTLSEVATKRN